LEKRQESQRENHLASSNPQPEDRRIDLYLRLEAFDRAFLQMGGEALAGVDEAGRGALAGPVVAAAVVLPPLSGLVGVNDSKKLKESEREELFEQIAAKAVSIGIARGTPGRIDRDNILNATLYAMAGAVGKLTVQPDIVLVDGRQGIDIAGRVIPVTRGDGKSLAVAAASIVAKVTRDRMMRRLHLRHPEYNFTKNKGYGTKEHRAAIEKYGILPHHRKTFALKGIEKNAGMFLL
jgi:ribonuclease HII